MRDFGHSELSTMDRPRERQRRQGKAVIVSMTVALLLLAVAGIASVIRSSDEAVSKDGIMIDVMQRGRLIHEISGPGRLVPEDMRVIAAHTRAQVERRLVEPGTPVEVDTPLLSLSDPDLQLALLEARKDLAAAESEFVLLRSEQDRNLLEQDGIIQSTQYMHLDAIRQAEAYDDLAKSGGVSRIELARAHDRVEELEKRQEIERDKKSFLEESREAQLTSQQVEIVQLRKLVEFQEKQVDLLNVTAPIAGVVQNISVQPGQWVAPGDALAEIITPDRLKAELRVAQTDADEISVGQVAIIDTRLGVVEGMVTRVAPSVIDGAVIVEARLNESLPKGVRAQLTVIGTLRVAELDNINFVRRPPGVNAYSDGFLFRLKESGGMAERIAVSFGLASKEYIQVFGDLSEGDQFIVSDMSDWADRSELKLTD